MFPILLEPIKILIFTILSDVLCGRECSSVMLREYISRAFESRALRGTLELSRKC